MHLKTSQILFVFIHASILSISFCQNNPKYENCIQTFRCGSLSNLSYPFWGGSRPLSCGYPGFELNCDGDGGAPLLNISSLSYLVLQINFSTNTLKLTRQDLWNNTCPKILRNTSLDPDLFQIPPDFNDANITLYFNCTDDRKIRVLNLTKFSCNVNGVATINAVGASSGAGAGITCGGSISVPVNRTAARALETPAASSINVLRAALASGFFVKWSADNSGCENCQQSGGACGYDQSVGTSACYKKSQGSMQVGAATPAPVARVEAPAPTASPPRRSSGQLGKILGIVFGVIGTNVLSVAVVCYLRRRCMERRPNSNQVTNQDIEKFLLQHGSLASKRYRYSEIKKMTKSFDHKLGQGGYGIVYKGVLLDGCPVAVKVLSETNGDGEDGEEFINEVASISRTSHVNIVNLLGFCYDGNQRALVYEFMPNKSLDKFISKSGLVKADCGLDLNKLYKIAVGVAKGLEYLHTGCNTRIVHFDIKPQNILLDDEFCPKISDFGLAKLCKKKQSVLSMLGARGTIGYIAPEVFSRNFGGVSHKSDVYSYGMMLLKMAGATKINVDIEVIPTDENYFPDKIYEREVINDATKRLDESRIGEEEETRRKMFLAGFWCVQTMPSDRPSISKVVEMLEGSLESIQIPPKPILFTGRLAGQEISALSSLQTEEDVSLEV